MARRLLAALFVAALLGIISVSCGDTDHPLPPFSTSDSAKTPTPKSEPWTVDSLVDFTSKELNAWWLGVAQASNPVWSYRAPVTVKVVDQGVSTPCGPIADAGFCRVDTGIYLDRRLLQDLLDGRNPFYDPSSPNSQRNRPGLGDMSVAVVLAHEWGHHIQHLFYGIAFPGITPKVEVELQADCFAGAFAARLRERGFTEDSDYDKAIAAMEIVGDPGYNRQGPDAHGTSGNRIDAFKRGYDGGGPQACLPISQFPL